MDEHTTPDEGAVEARAGSRMHEAAPAYHALRAQALLARLVETFNVSRPGDDFDYDGELRRIADVVLPKVRLPQPLSPSVAPAEVADVDHAIRKLAEGWGLVHPDQWRRERLDAIRASLDALVLVVGQAVGPNAVTRARGELARDGLG